VPNAIERRAEQNIIQNVVEDVQGFVRARRVIKVFVEQSPTNDYVFDCAMQHPAFKFLPRHMRERVQKKDRNTLVFFLWKLAIAINTKLRLPPLENSRKTDRENLWRNLKRFERPNRTWNQYYKSNGFDDTPSSGYDKFAHRPRQYSRRQKHVKWHFGVMV
jgi:hypothetical protein